MSSGRWTRPLLGHPPPQHLFWGLPGYLLGLRGALSSVGGLLGLCSELQLYPPGLGRTTHCIGASSDCVPESEESEPLLTSD